MSVDASGSSSLPAPALAASRAAVSSAIGDANKSDDNPAPLTIVTSADGNDSAADQDATPDGQEISTLSQLEQIRTVFSDPSNFNVKVRTLCVIVNIHMLTLSCSTRSTRLGLFGSIRLLQRAATCRPPPRHLPSPPHSQPPLVLMAVGWTTSRRSSALTAWRNSGGELSVPRSRDLAAFSRRQLRLTHHTPHTVFTTTSFHLPSCRKKQTTTSSRQVIGDHDESCELTSFVGIY